MLHLLLVVLLPATAITCSSPVYVTDVEWNNYKMTYAKVYPTAVAESNARYNYEVNKNKTSSHNSRYVSGLESYTLGINQYSDLDFLEFAASFPPTTDIASHGVPFILPSETPQASFSYNSLGFTSPVQTQDLTCNSGWAYATATALQIYYAVISGNPSSGLLSAKNFIDCAGAARRCIDQVPQAAFDYLTLYAQRVFPAAEYPNDNVGLQMCILPVNKVNGKTLASYSNIPNGDDAKLKVVVNYVAPVVIKFNPGSFEFMHYKAGIFTQPTPTQDASHYMTVVGYGTAAGVGKDYWLVENSFGVHWGEVGCIRIERNDGKPITRSAIFPSA